MRVRELADWLGAPFEGDGEREITGVAAVDSAGSGEISFAAGRQAGKQAAGSAAGCLLVAPDFPAGSGRTLIRTADPRGAFARAVRRFHPEPAVEPGVHPSATVDPGAEIGENVAIGPQVNIAAGAKIGPGTSIGAGSAIGRRASIGEGCKLHANVTIYDDVDVGDRVVLHSGSVIGADGFGFVLHAGRYEKFPQVGRVWIGSDVEIGANSCIDRAALGVTWIGEGTKLDNMVHIGHNCRIGKHVVIAAQTGLSGGVVVGDHAVIGGQVGIGDKVRIEAGAVLGSGAGVLTSKIVRAGQVMWGTPARPLKEYLETLANMARLPELREQVREMRKRLEDKT
ncbi:MAG: UDP-3-O-(3-hydroxymyristoyl)glucosamine N-acyltransferase [Acidobacteria bacterium]|nr:UDP-3-O-(3-hydroxymyristoyl)glucosamine N-acyltransferase [Acidobacteriota bacterium]